MAAFVGILFIIYIIFLIRRKSTDFLDPSVLFTIIILATYFLACLHLSDLQSKYPIWFTMLILGLIFCFYLGCQTGKSIRISSEPEPDNYSPSTMRIVTFLLWFAIVVAFLITVRQLGAPPTISGTERSDYFLSGWGSIVLLQSTLIGLLLYDRYNQKALGRTFWPYMISIVIIALLFANKYQILYMLVLAIVAKNTYGKKIRFFTLITAAAISVILFLLLYIFVYKDMYGISMSTIYTGYRMRIPEKLQNLTQPYLYAAFNYENLYRYLTANVHHLHGYKTFNALIDSFHLDSILPSSARFYIHLYLKEWKTMLKVPSLTTGTIFEDFAQDGGIPWMIIGTFLCGIWSSYCSRKFKAKKNFAWFFLYASAIVSICFAFFSNAFTSKVTFINIIASILVGFIIKYTFTMRGKPL